MNHREIKRLKRARWMKARRRDLEVLGIEPPAVFAGDKPLPLAIGAGGELVASVPEEMRPKARRFLYAYTKSEWYLWQCVKPGSMRYALSGEPVEPVSELHREHAERLARAQQAKRLSFHVTRLGAEAAGVLGRCRREDLGL